MKKQAEILGETNREKENSEEQKRQIVLIYDRHISRRISRLIVIGREKSSALMNKRK